MNVYDQLVRYAAKSDPAGFLGWLVPGLTPPLGVLGWLDARTLPFPGEPDRVCDTVAELADPADPATRLALVTEFQLAPDAEMLDRLLEYLARLRRGLRHGPDRRGRYLVVAALVNLTGPPQPDTLEMAPPGLGAPGLRFRVAVRTLRDEDAAATLAAIAAGAVAPVVLVWIPLMRGSAEPTIIDGWKALAGAEPDPARRAMYGAFALILADLAGRKAAWTHALEGWNVIESPILNEWRAEWEAKALSRGKAEGKAEGLAQARRADLLRVLGLRFPGPVPEALAAAVAAQADPDVLARWLDAAVTAPSLADARRAVGC